ncbi:putative gamma-tubulin complex component protein [Helianthus annuus]|uniref:Gamma-tubulin complex component n=1 Tax=Helianthus annuus TaxID=4232 RepID=A0A9K3NRG9_HELAN|nr:gamma-tubulin complex component 3 isoform X2 [Helianthus annuus]KAF5809856.1 putative gamma-tubulin complex component protein [Helianthus annuus]KAJ0580812.1 putative gamma-tubulin complex component protein [Helianthus annuus]KAJ0596755.1 putative gamma-tubulin complex component protein [Helianthus annuus]KAJ0757433.1 putative gamma-tubulin complex component protein [Helianthus annuus]KAJ0761132.1 putative gamma-tubulin complex component protein [Helianthus annuus]
MDSDHRVGDLVRQLVHHLQNTSSSNPNPEDVNYAIRILSSRMTPPSQAADEANSIKSRLAKQSKLSHALTFADLYSKFASKTGPGSVINKQSLLYLLKVISEDRVTNPHPKSRTDSCYNLLKNGGVLNIVRNPNNTVVRDFARLVSEESDVLEKDLVSDVLSVCEGIHGKYVKFDEMLDSYVLSESIKVSKGMRIMVLKLCELGWLFRKVNRYVCDDIGENVGKSFRVGLQDEVVEYRKLLTVLQSQSLNLSLRRLAVWFVEPMVKMRRMALLVDSCKDLKGGALAGEIHLHAQHGDPLLHEFMKRLLLKVSSPVFEMVRSWVMQGNLQDLHSEFFVSEQSVKPELLWKEGYQINYLMLPSFISKSLATRVLRTGQGDFVQYLMETVGPVLAEPAKTISLIHLSGLVEKAILSSGAQYDDRDILDRIKVKMMMPHGVKDRGWDVFHLDYDIRVPLNTVFTESVMGSYLRVFSFLWKIRRVEHAVLGAWKTMKPNLTSCHVFTNYPKAVGLQIVSTSRKCQLLWDKMNNFVMSMQAYIMFEVLEVTWAKFCNEMEASKDLDDLIAAHEKYLVTIVEKSLLGETSEALYKALLMLLDVILRFTSVADRLYEFRTRNTATSKTKDANKTSKSKGLETDSWLNEGRKAVTQRAGEFLSIIGQDLDAVSKEYSSVLKGFISQLPTQRHVDLKFLMFRLDFTEFYKLAA